MLQLRLWLTVAVIVLAGVVLTLQGTNVLNERVMVPFNSIADQSAAALQGAVVRNAADSVDAATRASVDANVRAALRSGTSTPEVESALLAQVGILGAPTFAVVAKPDGAVVLRAGNVPAFESPITGFPVFAEASLGLARDGVHFFENKPVHLAAAPIYDGANLAGVVVQAWTYDAALVDRIAKSLDAAVVLTTNKERIGSALPALGADALGQTGGSVGAFDLGGLPGFLPILLKEEGRYMVRGAPMYSGEKSIQLVVAIDRNPAYVTIAGAQLAVLLTTLLIALFQIALIVTTLQTMTKSVTLIVDHLSHVSQGNSVGILPEAGLDGQFLRLGKQVNMILQMMPTVARGPAGVVAPMQGALPRSTSGTVPAVSGAMPATPAAPSTSDLPKSAAAPAQSSKSPERSNIQSASLAIGELKLGRAPTPATEPAAAASVSESSISRLFEDSLADAPAMSAAASPADSGASTGSADALSDQELILDALDGAMEPAGAAPMTPEATVMFQVPQELLSRSVARSTTGTHSIPSPSPAQADDARTVIHAVPAELLSVSAQKRGDDIDDAHFHEVYDKFVQTRIECGEDTSDLTYDRFVVKLMKNRQQILDKHNAKGVRFQVYVKEGKAALRALPVRD